MKTLKIVIITGLCLLAFNVVFTQNRWSVAFRPGLNFPTQNIKDEDVDTGFGLELTVGYRFEKHLSTYAGWGYNTFASDDYKADFEETNYTLGLEFMHPIGGLESISYFLKGAAIYSNIKIENIDNQEIASFGFGWGWFTEAGINYVIGRQNWSLRPSVRYHALRRNVDIENQPQTVNLNYLSFGLGVAKTF